MIKTHNSCALSKCGPSARPLNDRGRDSIRRRLWVRARFRDLRQQLIRLTFLEQRHLERLCDILEPEPLREVADGAVAGDLVMLNLLRCRDQPRVERRIIESVLPGSSPSPEFYPVFGPCSCTSPKARVVRPMSEASGAYGPRLPARYIKLAGETVAPGWFAAGLAPFLERRRK